VIPCAAASPDQLARVAIPIIIPTAITIIRFDIVCLLMSFAAAIGSESRSAPTDAAHSGVGAAQRSIVKGDDDAHTARIAQWWKEAAGRSTCTRTTER
jgi:hypothetical protein